MSREVIHKPENKTRILSTERTEGHGKGGGARGHGMTSEGQPSSAVLQGNLHDRLSPKFRFRAFPSFRWTIKTSGTTDYTDTKDRIMYEFQKYLRFAVVATSGER